MDNITAAEMWQESNNSKKPQRIVLRYLSNFFGSRLVVPEYCIDKLGQNPVTFVARIGFIKAKKSALVII